MSGDDRKEALVAWRELLTTATHTMSAAQHYEELLRMADAFGRLNLITTEEKNALILEATDHYANTVTGLKKQA